MHIVRAFVPDGQSDTYEAPGLGPEVLGLGPVTVTKIVSRLVGVEEEDDCPSLASGDEATSVALRGWAPVTVAGGAPMHSDKGRSPGPREVLLVETHPVRGNPHTGRPCTSGHNAVKQALRHKD